MGIRVEKANGLTMFMVDGDMTIYQAAEFKNFIFDNLQGAEVVEFYLSAVSEMDTAGAQLLMLAVREAKAGRISVKIAAHSSVTRKIFDLYNLTCNL